MIMMVMTIMLIIVIMMGILHIKDEDMCCGGDAYSTTESESAMSLT